MTPIRLTTVATHPVQYQAPWFRYIAANCPAIDLTVLYASRPTPRQQAVEFDTSFEWDTNLFEGYTSRVVRDSMSEASFGVGSFRALDVPEIGAEVMDTRPDVVLVFGWHSITLVRAVRACRRHGVPVLYRGDTNLLVGPSGWRRIVWHVRTRALLRLYSAHLAVGRRSREYLLAHGVAPSRVYTSPHAVDNEFFAASAAPHLSEAGRAVARTAAGLAPGDFAVLFAGKLATCKRVPDVVRAVARLGPHAALLVAGSGPEENAVREEARRLGVRVTHMGFMNQSRVAEAYAAADCLVLPSDSESWGLVVNEAMATGLPAVVSDRVGCAPDLVASGETGEIFPVGNIGDLAAALGRVRGRGGRQAMAPACRERIARYSLERAAGGLVAACQAVARRHPSPPPRVIACCGGMVVVTGLERMTFEVLQVVRRRGGSVHCIVNGWENHRIVALAERIGATWSEGYYGQTFSRRTRSPLRISAMAWDVVRTSGGLLRDAVRFKPSHVLIPDYLSAIRNAPVLLLLRVFGVGIVLRLGNAPDTGRFFQVLWRHVIDRLVDTFVCNSVFTKRELLAHGVPDRKVLQIYNIAPVRGHFESSLHRDPRRIVYVGQVIPEKGLAELLDAVGLLVNGGHEVRLDVIGAVDGWVSPSYGDFRERLMVRATSPDLAGRVRFLGWREDVPAILASAAVHCCPSQPRQREAFGVVNLEAKLAGMPSVVTPVGALPELVVHGVDGWICRDATAEALAEGLAYFLDDPVRAVTAGEQARRSLSRFGRDRFEHAWSEVFS